jgi:cyclopropane fatty-acyl-phospholipid synthase-like methyltransferase
MTQHPHPPHGAGKSSYDLIDPEKLFAALELDPGLTVLDLGCGAGRYALPLAQRLGISGQVYAVDLWEEGQAALPQSFQDTFNALP